MKSWHSWTLVLLLAMLQASTARAEPKHIRLAELLPRLSMVAVGRCLGHERLPSGGQNPLRYTLSVNRVLFGDPSFKGTRAVSISGHMHVKDGTPCVALLNRHKTLEWVAVPVRGSSLQNVPLKLSGIYSYNAYLVTPHLITLAGLPQLLRTGRFRVHVEGALHFVDPQSGRVAPSSILLEVDLEWPSGRHRVRGLPKLVGFPAPRVGLGVALYDDVYIVYHLGHPRPLSIGGVVYGLLPNGTMLARFYVVLPKLLRQEDFLRYVADASLQQRYYVLEVKTSGERPLRFELGKVTYRDDRMTNDRRGPWRLNRDLDKGEIIALRGNERIAVTFPPPRALSIRRAGRLERLVGQLLRGPVACRISIQRGLGIAGRGCTLSLKSIVLAPFPAK